jgi:hypothetical protein
MTMLKNLKNNPMLRRRLRTSRFITKKGFCVSLEIELHNKLRETSESKDCSVSYIINECVKAYLPEFVLLDVPYEKRKSKPWKFFRPR